MQLCYGLEVRIQGYSKLMFAFCFLLKRRICPPYNYLFEQWKSCYFRVTQHLQTFFPLFVRCSHFWLSTRWPFLPQSLNPFKCQDQCLYHPIIGTCVRFLGIISTLLFTPPLLLFSYSGDNSFVHILYIRRPMCSCFFFFICFFLFVIIIFPLHILVLCLISFHHCTNRNRILKQIIIKKMVCICIYMCLSNYEK